MASSVDTVIPPFKNTYVKAPLTQCEEDRPRVCVFVVIIVVYVVIIIIIIIIIANRNIPCL